MNPVEERPMLPAQGIAGPSSGVLTSLVQVLLRLFGVYGFRLNRVLPKDGTEAMEAPLELETYTVATLPAFADYEGCIIYVSDGAGGTKFRGSNGAAWVNLG